MIQWKQYFLNYYLFFFYTRWTVIINIPAFWTTWYFFPTTRGQFRWSIINWLIIRQQTITSTSYKRKKYNRRNKRPINKTFIRTCNIETSMQFLTSWKIIVYIRFLRKIYTYSATEDFRLRENAKLPIWPRNLFRKNAVPGTGAGKNFVVTWAFRSPATFSVQELCSRKDGSIWQCPR